MSPKNCSISIPELQEKYPQLAPIKPIHYKYEAVEIIIRQEFYHAIRAVEYLLGKDYFTVRRTLSDRLGFKWSVTAVLKTNRTRLVSCRPNKTWYELESYGAFKQVDALSAADHYALSVLKNDTFHDGERYIVPMLWNDKESTLPYNYFSSLAQLKSLERRLDKDPSLREKYGEKSANYPQRLKSA